jgi:hypothetical protein
MLGVEIREWMPPSIYKKSNSMNYVLVKTISRLLDQPDLLSPYLDQGLAEAGERLSSYLAEPDSGYVGDMRIADSWARELGIADWYQWTSSNKP